ncbi:MAG TPA: hypothetical protein VI076_01180 [Actinopolymorphaceae bacterium]
MTNDLESRLRTELTRRSATLPRHPDPYGMVHGRLVRRRRRVVAGTACLAVGVLAVGALVVPRPGEDPRIAQQVATTKTPVTGIPSSPKEWPVRGSLAHDEEYLERVRALVREENSSEPDDQPVTDVHIVYAGEVRGDEVVVALVTRRTTWGDFDHTYAVLDPFAEGDLRRTPRAALHPGGLVVALDSKDGGRLLVVAAPGVDRMELSPRPILHRTGRITRSWSKVTGTRLEEGVILASVPRGTTTLGIRAVADGEVAHDFRMEPRYFAPIDDRLKRLAENAVEGSGKHLGEELSRLEADQIGKGAIESVEEVWRTPTGPRTWHGLRIRTDQGATIEVAYLYREGQNSQESSKAGIRPVAPDAVGRTPTVLLDRCTATGHVGAVDATTAVALRGERELGRASVEDGTFAFTATPRSFCDPADPQAEFEEQPFRVRLLDDEGKVLWESENLLGSTLDDWDLLDTEHD